MTEHKAKDDDSPQPRSRWRWLGHIGLILVAFLVLHWWRSQDLASGDAPPLAGRLIDAGVFDLSSLRGQPVLVHFWATWCPACKMGDQTIDAIADDYSAITVAMQSGDADTLAQYMREEDLAFPVLADPHGALATSWGVRGVPASFVVDGDGRIRFATIGYTTEIGLRGRLWATGKLF